MKMIGPGLFFNTGILTDHPQNIGKQPGGQVRHLPQSGDPYSLNHPAYSVRRDGERRPGAERHEFIRRIPALTDKSLRPDTGLTLQTGLQRCGMDGCRLGQHIETQPQFARRRPLWRRRHFQMLFKFGQFLFRQRPGNIFENTVRVEKTFQHPIPGYFSVGQFQESLPQCQQRATQITAVHGRYVIRQQRF